MIHIVIPPLRERPGDVVVLARALWRVAASGVGSSARLTPSLLDVLAAYAWPGNVRELRNLVERLFYLHGEDRIEAVHVAAQFTPLPTSPAAMPLSLPLAEATDDFQREFIKRQILAAGGNMTVAAQRLGLHRSNFYRKLKQLGLEDQVQ